MTTKPLTVRGWAVKLEGVVLLDTLRNSQYGVEKLIRERKYPTRLLVEVVPVTVTEESEHED